MTQNQTAQACTEWLAYRGRFVNVTFMLRSGDQEFLITIRDGVVKSIAPGPHVMARWTFALVSDPQSWGYFWSETPRPRYHDLMAMVKFKLLRIEGDQGIFMANLLYFKELIGRLGSEIHARS